MNVPTWNCKYDREREVKKEDAGVVKTQHNVPIPSPFSLARVLLCKRAERKKEKATTKNENGVVSLGVPRQDA